MTIPVNQLREIANKLCDHLSEAGTSTVEVDQDYYWHIPRESVFNPYEVPLRGDLSLGRLSDDWQDLMKVAAGDQEPLAYDCVKFGAILRAIGENIPR